MPLKITTLYTLYGRRAGAELSFEKTLSAMAAQAEDVHWTVLCNHEARPILESLALPHTVCREISALNNQFKKALWLECHSLASFQNDPPDVFWNPSGCNHFPGPWPFPTLTTFHDLGEYHVRHKYDLKRTIFRKCICIPKSLRRSAAFTAVSNFTANDLSRLFGLKNVPVVHNGPSPYHFTRRPDASQILARNIGPAPLPFWFVPGRTDFIGKGLDVLLSALEHHPPPPPAPHCVFFAGPPGNGHHRFLRRLHALDANRNQLRYLGRVSDSLLESLYQECFAVILPSRFEGFGFPVLEAMDAGVPLICSNAGSLPEVAGNAALFFPSGNAAALASRMTELAHSPSLRARQILAGKQRSKHFSWQTCGRQMLRILRQTAAHHPICPTPPH